MRLRSYCDPDPTGRTIDDDPPARTGDDMLRTTQKLAFGLALVAVAVTPAAASAKDGDSDRRPEVRVGGSCTGGTTSKLKAKHDDGRLEVEFEVDQNRNGVRWTVKVRRNGGLVINTARTTRPPSGSFSLERKIANPAGSDRITARATSPSGEVCSANLTIG
jgi:hypothetical protein